MKTIFLLILPLFSFAQILETKSFQEFETRIIKGEEYKLYPMHWQLGDDDFQWIDSLQDGKYVVYAYDTNSISLLFEMKNYSRITDQFFFDDGTSQLFNKLTNKQYHYDKKNRLTTVDSIANDTLNYTLYCYDSIGNVMVENGNGVYKFYYENGRKKSEGKVKNGLQEGKFTYWDENGHVLETGFYEKGVRVGRWKKWTSEVDRDDEKNKKISNLIGKKIEGIFFDKTFLHLDTISFKSLNKIILQMKAAPQSKIELHFFTENARNGYIVDEKWIQETIDYFIKNGIQASSILAFNYADSTPIINKEKLNKIKIKKRHSRLELVNQRIEYKIIK